MQKEVEVTYHAPQGDSKVVEMFGVTFYDGKPETVLVDETQFNKMKGNKHFEVGQPREPKPDHHEKASHDTQDSAHAAKSGERDKDHNKEKGR
jgi:hypothetical protein